MKSGNPFKNSVIVNAAKKFADFVYVAASHSIAGRIFSGYENEKSLTDRSHIAGRLNRLGIARKNRHIKHQLMRKSESSVLTFFFSDVLDSLRASPLKNYGLFLFIFALISFGFTFLRNAGASLPAEYFVYFGALILISVLLLLSGKTLAQAVTSSGVCEALLFRLFGINREPYEKSRVGRNHFAVPVLFGFGLGIIAGLFSPRYVLYAFILLLFIKNTTLQPETGVLTEIIILPFCSARLSAFVIFYTLISYVFRLFKGKRTFRYGILDITVIAFGIVLAFGSVFSLNTDASISRFIKLLLGIILFFLIVNLMKNSDWTDRCIKLLGFDITVVVLFSLFNLLSGYFGLSSFITGITGGAFPVYDRISGIVLEMIVLFTPLLLDYIRFEERLLRKLFLILIVVAAIVIALSSGNSAVWIALIVAFAFYLILISKLNLIILIVAALAFILSRFLFPVQFAEIFEVFGRGITTGSGANVFPAVIKMIRACFFGGAGLGSFSTLYQSYILENIPSASDAGSLYLNCIIEIGIVGLILLLAVFIVYAQSNFSYYQHYNDPVGKRHSAAAFSGIIGILTLGLFEYVFLDFRVFIMVFTLMAVGNAVRRNSKREVYSKTTDTMRMDLTYWRGEVSTSIINEEGD